MDLPKLHLQILPIIDKAIDITLDSFGKDNKIEVKEGVASQAALVTEVDKKLDALFREGLERQFPDIGFITEEGNQGEIREYNWIIDPIDGTTNYSRNYPMFGISIALWKGNEPVYGSITLPKLSKIMYGFKNGGVFLNNERLQNNPEKISPKPFVFLAPVAKPQDHGKVTAVIGESVAAPRDFGCSVYQAYETIIGNADLAVNYKLSLWDIGASVLLAKEANLEVKFITPKPDITSFTDYTQTVVFGRSDLVIKVSGGLTSLL